MKVPRDDINRPPTGRAAPPAIVPSKVISDDRWSRTLDDDWRADAQPYYARASFTKLCLPAVLYSLVLNASQRVLRLVPFASSRLRIGVEELRARDCFVPDVSGGRSSSIAVVTGSNTGVGFETASGLAERGYHVVLACRSREKGEAAAERINDRLDRLLGGDGDEGRGLVDHFVEGGKASFLHPLDLSSFASVRSFCKVFGDNYDSLSILVNNAGTNAQGDVTEDGLEMCWQSNFVGHFLLTKLLLGHLQRAKNTYPDGSGYSEEAGRVVNLSSVTHHFAPANERPIANTTGSSKDQPLDNGIHDEHFWLSSAIPGLSAGTYRESKLASILFTLEINKRFGEKGIRSIAANPGSVSSDIWRDESPLVQRAYKMVYLTPQQGATTSIAGAIGAIPRDALYLQPYWQPQRSKPTEASRSSFRRRYGVPFPMTEMLGPYIGYAISEPRLPLDGRGGYRSSEALWSVCEKLATLGEIHTSDNTAPSV